jgi:hypothetical protein
MYLGLGFFGVMVKKCRGINAYLAIGEAALRDKVMSCQSRESAAERMPRQQNPDVCRLQPACRDDLMHMGYHPPAAATNS